MNIHVMDAYVQPEMRDAFYNARLREYRQMKMSSLRKLERELAPTGFLDSLAYFFEPARELSHLAVGQALDERLRRR